MDKNWKFKITRENSPCENCKERKCGCHDHCSSYKQFKDQNKVKKGQKENGLYTQYFFQKTENIKKYGQKRYGQ